MSEEKKRSKFKAKGIVDHGTRFSIAIIRVECVIVALAILELHIDGTVSALNQPEVQQQPSGATVAVDEGMDALETEVKRGDSLDRIGVVGEIHQKPLAQMARFAIGERPHGI